MPLGGNGAGGYRLLAIEEIRIGNAAHMPKLQEDVTALLVNGIDNRLPAFRLLVGPDARRVGIAHAYRIDRRGFGHDETCTRALRIIFDSERRGHAAAF